MPYQYVNLKAPEFGKSFPNESSPNYCVSESIDLTINLNRLENCRQATFPQLQEILKSKSITSPYLQNVQEQSGIKFAAM